MGVAPVLLVLILGDDPPRAPEEFKRVLGALARRPSHVVLRLAGLAAAVAALLDANPELDAEAVPRRTGGNPYFVRSVVALGDAAALPGGGRDTCACGWRSCPRAAASYSPPWRWPVETWRWWWRRRRRTGQSASWSRPFAACLRSGLVVEPVPGRLRIAHDIVSEAVAAELTPAARVALHGRLADALAAVTPQRQGSPDTASRLQAGPLPKLACASRRRRWLARLIRLDRVLGTDPHFRYGQPSEV